MATRFELRDFVYFLIRHGYPIESVGADCLKIGHFYYFTEKSILTMESVQIPDEGGLKSVYDFLIADDTMAFFEQAIQEGLDDPTFN